MKTQRIFILSPHTLLARGVERLLQNRRGLRVVGTETDPQQGIQRIQTLHPDVVISGSESAGPPSLAAVSAMFEASPGTTVIGLSAGDNLIHIYEDRQVQVANVDDLIRVIRQARTAKAPAKEKLLTSPSNGERRRDDE